MTDNMLNYKGFSGSVEYSANDECFFGKIIGTADLVTFEGESVVKLKKAFNEAVEDYLALCKEAGKEPQKTYKGSFNVRLTPELHRQTAVLAKKMSLSLNGFVEKAITDEIAMIYGSR